MVRRRWAPRLGRDTLWRRFRRRIRRTVSRAGDVGDAGCIGDVGEGIVAALLLIAAALVVLFVILPLVVAIVDLVVVLLVTGLGLAGRIVFRRPWAIDAFGPDRAHLRWKVVGWRASRERATEIAELLAAGTTPPGAEHLHLVERRRRGPT